VVHSVVYCYLWATFYYTGRWRSHGVLGAPVLLGAYSDTQNCAKMHQNIRFYAKIRKIYGEVAQCHTLFRPFSWWGWDTTLLLYTLPLRCSLRIQILATSLLY